MDEIHKDLNDLALNVGRSIKSDETGFIHTYYGKKEAPHQAINFHDNCLYALSLCKSRTVEGIQEAKSLLEKLLAYQLSDGFFPSYLHEFPFCHDRHMGAAAGLVLYQLHHHFHKVLGAQLSEKLMASLNSLLKASLQEADKMSFSNRFRLGGVLEALGRQNDLMDVEGLLKHPSRFIPEHLGECFSGAVLTASDARNRLLQWMKNFWHPSLNCYAGPFLDVKFKRGLQSITLYDLYMIAEMGHVPARFKEPHLNLLKGALLFPFHHDPVFPSPLEDTVIEEHFGASFVKEPKASSCFFTLQWKNGLFALSAPSACAISQETNQRFAIDLGSLPNMENKESDRELFGYISEIPNLKILVNGKTATTFCVNDVVSIEDELMKITLVFEAPLGVFMGHISKGCMPTETENFGKNRFNAYQWQLFWRTISRQAPCRFYVNCTYEIKNSH